MRQATQLLTLAAVLAFWACSPPDAEEIAELLTERLSDRAEEHREALKADRWYPVEIQPGAEEIAETMEQHALRLEELQEGGDEDQEALARSVEMMAELDEAPIYHFVRRVDGSSEPAPMTDEQRSELNDPWFREVLAEGDPPLDLQSLVDTMDQVQERAGLDRVTFFLGEGGQIPVSADFPLEAERGFRFVIAWTRDGVAEIFAGTPAGERAGFLEVFAWDPEKRAFNYYERKMTSAGESVWSFAGDSFSALDPATGGAGCFRCHVNGAPVMRELRRPWNNWHSEAALITTTVPDEIRFEQPRRTLFRQAQGAERLESLVRASMDRWNDTRFDEPNAEALAKLLEPAFRTTTANLVTSFSRIDAPEEGPESLIALPLSFFVNQRALRPLLEEDGGSFPSLKPQVRRDHYEVALAAIESRYIGGEADSFFVFSVPEAAFEDLQAVRRLYQDDLVSERVVASALLVDFPNPVYSPARASLHDDLASAISELGTVDAAVAHILEGVTPPADASGLTRASAIEQFAFHLSAPESEWRGEARRLLAKYFDGVRSQLGSASGIQNLLRLAVAQRARFAMANPGEHMLREVPVLFPQTNLTSSELRMGFDGIPHAP